MRKHGKDTANACKSRVITQVQNNVHILVHGNKPHNHDVSPLNEMEKQYKTELKRKALESKEIPSKIIREASTTHPPVVQIRSSKQAQKMIIRRKRTENDGGLRVIEEDGEFIVPEELQQTLNGQPFLQKSIRTENSHIMIFTTQAILQRLAASRYWLIDGTFATVPLQFTQLYSIHGSVQYQDHDSVVPLVFMLLNNKTQETYISAFEALLQICEEAQIDLRPRFIISDFEKAVVNVMREIFPDAECYLCYFHFAQNLIKQLSFRGLKPMYSTNMDVYMTIKRLQVSFKTEVERISINIFTIFLGTDIFTTCKDCKCIRGHQDKNAGKHAQLSRIFQGDLHLRTKQQPKANVSPRPMVESQCGEGKTAVDDQFTRSVA